MPLATLYVLHSKVVHAVESKLSKLSNNLRNSNHSSASPTIMMTTALRFFAVVVCQQAVQHHRVHHTVAAAFVAVAEVDVVER